jgi:hypothetical protein
MEPQNPRVLMPPNPRIPMSPNPRMMNDMPPNQSLKPPGPVEGLMEPQNPRTPMPPNSRIPMSSNPRMMNDMPPNHSMQPPGPVEGTPLLFMSLDRALYLFTRMVSDERQQEILFLQQNDLLASRERVRMLKMFLMLENIPEPVPEQKTEGGSEMSVLKKQLETYWQSRKNVAMSRIGIAGLNSMVSD